MSKTDLRESTAKKKKKKWSNKDNKEIPKKMLIVIIQIRRNDNVNKAKMSLAGINKYY